MTDPFDLHRTNINLYARDVEWLRRTYGYGWTEKVRDAIASYVRDQKQVLQPTNISRRYTEGPNHD